MGYSIIAISKIDARNACTVVVYHGFITDKNLCHDSIDAIATFFWKTLARDQIVLWSQPNQPFCKNDLFDPVEVCFKEAYSL